MPRKIDLWKERNRPELLLWQSCLTFSPDYTIYHKLEEWLRNFHTNHESRIFNKHESGGTFTASVDGLPLIKSAIIIDNPMTGSLNKHLKKLVKTKTPLLVCDRALPKLAENNITPRYVGNVDSSYLCLHPDMPIQTPAGIKRIADIRVDDLVFGHDGEIHKVTKTFQRYYSGELVALDATYSNSPVMMTPEHPILAIKRKYVRADQAFAKQLSNPDFRWIPAKEIKHLDFLYEPINMFRKKSWLSPELGRLIGYYLAEGSINEQNHVIQLYFGSHEKELIEDARKLILDQIVTEPHIYEHGSSCSIFFSSKSFYPFFANLGWRSFEKKLLPEMFILPKNVEKQIIRGAWFGDGTYWRGYAHGSYTYGTSSIILAYGLRHLLLRQGIIPRVEQRVPNGRSSTLPDGRIIRQKRPFWNLSVQGPDTIKLAEILEKPVPQLGLRRVKHARLTDQYLITPVKNVYHIPYEGLVYNLEVKGSNSYILPHFSMHNCLSFFDRPEVKPLMDKTTAIFATTAFPLTIRAWQGERAFFTPPLGQPLTETLAALSNTVIMNTGGNIATTLWILAINLGAKNIGILGIDNCYYNLKETEFPGAQHNTHETPYGVIFQDPVYKKYAEWHFEAIAEAKKRFDVTTYNLNKSGAMYGHGIIDMSLEEFDTKFA